MDGIERPENLKGLYGILRPLQGSHLANFLLRTLKLVWVHVAFHSVKFQLKCCPGPLGFLSWAMNIVFFNGKPTEVKRIVVKQ